MHCFECGFFSAKIKSTQRSESTNSVFHQIFGTSLPLIQVIECYERKAEDMRQGERDEDFHCKNSAPKGVISYGGILESAANAYTIKLFAMFKEFLEGVGLNYIEVNVEQKLVTYKLNKPSEKKAFFVKFAHPILLSFVAVSCLSHWDFCVAIL